MVVFDLGEVLVPSTAVLPRLAAELGITTGELDAVYWSPRTDHDLGGSAQSYWTAVLAALGRAPEPALLARLAAVDAAKWSTLPPESVHLLEQLRDGGAALAVLSNAPATLAAAVRAAPWAALVPHLVFSAEVALVKPDPAIYARADAVYGTRPQDVVFFDDRPVNVEAAMVHGWDAHLWVDAATALDTLARR